MRYKKKDFMENYFRLNKVFAPNVDKISGKIFINSEIEKNYKSRKITFVLTPSQATILLNTLLVFFEDNPEQLNTELMRTK